MTYDYYKESNGSYALCVSENGGIDWCIVGYVSSEDQADFWLEQKYGWYSRQNRSRPGGYEGSREIDMRDYFYIKVVEYAAESLYLNQQYTLVNDPVNLKIFNNIDKAYDRKKMLQDELGYRSDQVEIKRLQEVRYVICNL